MVSSIPNGDFSSAEKTHISGLKEPGSAGPPFPAPI